MRNRELQKASRLPETVHAKFWSLHLEPGPGHPVLLIVHSLESLIVHFCSMLSHLADSGDISANAGSYLLRFRQDKQHEAATNLFREKSRRQHDTPLYTRNCWYSGQSVAMNIYLLLKFAGEKGFYCWKTNLDENLKFASCKYGGSVFEKELFSSDAKITSKSLFL